MEMKQTMKLTNKSLWAFLIIILSVLGTGIGLSLLYVTKTEPVVINTKAGDIVLDGLSIEDARNKIVDYYKSQTEKGELRIEINGMPFSIPYLDIDVHVDIDNTIETLKHIIPKNGFDKLFSASIKNELTPVFTYNSGKLIRRCEELLSHYKTDPVDETYRIDNGSLVMVPGIPGLSVDYKTLEQELKGMFFTSAESYKIDIYNSPVIIKTLSKPFYEEPFTTLVSKSNIEFDYDSGEKVKDSNNNIENVIIENGKNLSLSSILDFSQFSGDMERDLLNRIATTIYQAALPIEGIKVLNRKPAQREVPYAEPGLEAVIEGENADLVLRNETGKALLLLSEIASNRLNIYFASTGEIKTGSITIEKKDPVPPSTITVVNNSLHSTVTRVISEGTPGYTAYVIRTIDGKSEEISRDKYLPISKTIETGARPINSGSK
ncbi:MAG: peptidoglycan binding domain-containing protein [Acetivibrionales bacterium]